LPEAEGDLGESPITDRKNEKVRANKRKGRKEGRKECCCCSSGGGCSLPTGQSWKIVKQKETQERRCRRRTTIRRQYWIGFGAETRHSFVTRARNLHTQTAKGERAKEAEEGENKEHKTTHTKKGEKRLYIYPRCKFSFLSFLFIYKIRQTETETEGSEGGAKVLYSKKDIYSAKKKDERAVGGTLY
jgi:hypothetical protein